MPRLFIPVAKGLITKKHRKVMSSAIWEFLWMVDRITKEVDGEGIVLGGRPITYGEISEYFGVHRNTVELNIGKLVSCGYLAQKRTPKGLTYAVKKSCKFSRRDAQKIVHPPTQEIVLPCTENCAPPEVGIHKKLCGDTQETVQRYTENCASNIREPIEPIEPINTHAATPPIITLPLADKSEFPVTAEQVIQWRELYPAVNVIQALRSMRGWCISNPTKRKTKTGVLRFVNSWLAREQDKPTSRQIPVDAKTNDDQEAELKRIYESVRLRHQAR